MLHRDASRRQHQAAGKSLMMLPGLSWGSVLVNLAGGLAFSCASTGTMAQPWLPLYREQNVGPNAVPRTRHLRHRMSSACCLPYSLWASEQPTSICGCQKVPQGLLPPVVPSATGTSQALYLPQQS